MAEGISGLSAALTPKAHCTASLGSIQNFGGYLGGALAPTVTGFIVQATGTFVPALLVGAMIALVGSRLPRGDPEPADPVGRARGSRTICTAKWCIYVTSSAPAVEGLGAAMSLSTDRQPGANPQKLAQEPASPCKGVH